MEARLGIKYGIEQFRAYTSNCKNIVPLQGYSPFNFEDWDKSIDLFYEDSVHQDPTLSLNLDFWSSHLKATGIACGDDFRPRFPDVTKGAIALSERMGRELITVGYFWCILPPLDLIPRAAAVRDTLLAIRAEIETDRRARPFAHIFAVQSKPSTAQAGSTLGLEVHAANESFESWSNAVGEIATAHVAVNLSTESGRSDCVAVAPLPAPLYPDVPVRTCLQVVLPDLTPGQYTASARLVLTGADGAVQHVFEPAETWPVEILGESAPAAQLPKAYRTFWEDKAPEFDQITETDVHAAYRIALGRPPEGDAAKIKKHLDAVADLAGLRERFLSSPEFYRNNVRVLTQGTIARAFGNVQEGVETDTDPGRLAMLFDHVQQVWSRLGKVEPHYSVFSNPRFKPEGLSAHQEAFYASGENEITRVMERVRKLGLTADFNGHAVEFGCGIGRVTRFLATYFRKVTGFDVSQPHLELAQEYLTREKITNVDLVHISTVDRVEIPPHNFFYSRIVFQHNPPPVSKYLLDRIMAHLQPGGISVFQLVTAIEGYRFNIDTYLAKMDDIDGQELHAMPQQEVFALLATRGLIPVEVARDASVTGFDRTSTSFVVRRPINAGVI